MRVMFKLGDIVSRDGTDEHVVIVPPEDTGLDNMTVVCIKEPLGYLMEDGITRGEPWIKRGEIETNLNTRYELVVAAK